jgi:hypothetical protein
MNVRNALIYFALFVPFRGYSYLCNLRNLWIVFLVVRQNILSRESHLLQTIAGLRDHFS